MAMLTTSILGEFVLAVDGLEAVDVCIGSHWPPAFVREFVHIWVCGSQLPAELAIYWVFVHVHEKDNSVSFLPPFGDLVG
jgi:hypothetical protein